MKYRRLQGMNLILLNMCVYLPYANCYVKGDNCYNCEKVPSPHGNFNCSNCGLQEIPRFPLESTSIDLCNNEISSITNYSFHGLIYLQELCLNNNIISSIGKGSFLSLLSLRSLSLGNNRLGVDALENLKDLPHLLFLDVGRNKYTMYPESFALMRNLNLLKIDVFDGFNFNDNFLTLRNLSKLNLNPREKFSIHNESFQGLQNSPINELELRFHKMVYGPIGDSFLRPFKWLRRLKVDISYNFDIKEALKILYGVRDMSLDFLDLSGNNWNIMRQVHLTLEDIEYLLTMCIKELNLFNNRIYFFPFLGSLNTSFSNCLEKLIMSSNTMVWTFNELFGILYYPKLQYLDTSAIIYRSSKPSIDHSDVIDLNDIWQRVNITLEGLAPLKYLDISGIHLGKMKIYPFRYISNFPHLTTIKARNTDLAICNYDVYFSTSLSYLDMSGWQCSQINPNFIRRHQNLTYLNMANSEIGNYINTNLQNPIFRGLCKLESINLSGNNIKTFEEDFFEDQKHTLRSLYLRENELRAIPSALAPLHRLLLIDLSANYFTHFEERDRHLMDMFGNATFNFEGNRFVCSCKYVDSLVWIRGKKNIKNTFCQDGTEVSFFLKNIRTFQLSCLSEFWLDFSVILLLLTIITIVIVAFGYRNKAVVIYLYLKAQRIIKQRNREMKSANYKYDAFVSYSHLDVDWVTGLLFQYLTKELSLQVCIHQKDFIPGEPIAEEILRCIDSSRKSIFVITRNFLDSEWSLFEMDIARQHVFMSDNDTILVILKDDIPVHELPNLLKKIWWRIVCLQYPHKDEPEEIQNFWTRLSKVFVRD